MKALFQIELTPAFMEDLVAWLSYFTNHAEQEPDVQEINIRKCIESLENVGIFGKISIAETHIIPERLGEYKHFVSSLKHYVFQQPEVVIGLLPNSMLVGIIKNAIETGGYVTLEIVAKHNLGTYSDQYGRIDWNSKIDSLDNDKLTKIYLELQQVMKK